MAPAAAQVDGTGMTPAELRAATGCSAQNAERWAPHLTAAMAEFDIDTPTRQAAFLAQVAHESGLFRWTSEIWGPTPAQMRYSQRADLGNTRPEARRFAEQAGVVDPGKFYRGHGLIQVTGYLNHVRAGQVLGIDAAAHPELLAEPEYAARSAGDFWRDHGLNPLADEGAFELITRRINGGLNGYAERCVLWDRARRALGVVP